MLENSIFNLNIKLTIILLFCRNHGHAAWNPQSIGRRIIDSFEGFFAQININNFMFITKTEIGQQCDHSIQTIG